MLNPEIEAALGQLTDAMLQTPEYHIYLEYSKKLKEHPELKQRLDEMRQRNYEMQKSGENLYHRIDELEREFEFLRENPITSAYLESENAVCRMIRQVLDGVSERVPVEIPFQSS